MKAKEKPVKPADCYCIPKVAQCGPCFTAWYDAGCPRIWQGEALWEPEPDRNGKDT